MSRPGIAVALLLFALPALAQPASQPYAGSQNRPLKALSEKQVADLKAGRGMGMALPAELNGYPGPLHVLEHADTLGLTSEQRGRTRALFEAMKAEAMRLGERLISEEMALERLFATRTVQPSTLAAATSAVAATQGELRATHLRYHLAMMDVLTPDQVQRYGQVRGYGSPDHAGHGQHQHGTHRP